jgi:excisionase family DNA binding protein
MNLSPDSPVTNHDKMPSDPLLSRSEAATYIGVAVQTLACWQSTGRYRIPIVKVGRLVRYRRSTMDAFLQKRTIGPVNRDEADRVSPSAIAATENCASTVFEASGKRL